MGVFRRIVFSSVLAGLFVGVLITLAHQVGTVPLILRGEAYEQAAEAAAPAAPAMAIEDHDHAAATAAHSDEHEHGDSAWAPTNGLERNLLTAAADILTAIGFALMLSAAYVLTGRPVTWREGLFWGLAGFAIFTIAPGLGLAPELPGMPATDLGPRQIWWIGTAVATAAGLGLIVFQRSLVAATAGVVLIAAPHVIGAPAPADTPTNVPGSLWHEFVVAVTVTSFLFWALLGGVTGALHQRFSRG
jgi:cobalt transporter subunit CbtA